MRSISAVVLCMFLFVVCSVVIGRVSADGSIQPFMDSECQSPLANATNIPMVSSPDCQWLTVDNTQISFSYQCYNGQSGNFSLVLWTNASAPCNGLADFEITASFAAQGQGCAVADYEDANNNVHFYGQIYCYATWPPAIAGAGTVAEVAWRGVEQTARAQKDMVHTLAALVPQGTNSAIHRLAQLLKQQYREQQTQ